MSARLFKNSALAECSSVSGGCNLIPKASCSPTWKTRPLGWVSAWLNTTPMGHRAATGFNSSGVTGVSSRFPASVLILSFSIAPYIERLAVYPPCPDGWPFKLEGDILGHGGYTPVELNR